MDANNTSIGISKSLLKRLKLIAVMTDKKLYELISEAVKMLEDKYHIIHGVEDGHE